MDCGRDTITKSPGLDCSAPSRIAPAAVWCVDEYLAQHAAQRATQHGPLRIADGLSADSDKRIGQSAPHVRPEPRKPVRLTLPTIQMVQTRMPSSEPIGKKRASP